MNYFLICTSDVSVLSYMTSKISAEARLIIVNFGKSCFDDGQACWVGCSPVISFPPVWLGIGLLEMILTNKPVLLLP